MNKLATIQNKALKSVFLLPYRAHIASQLSANNIFKVDQLITLIRVEFIHNLRMERLPPEFSGLVTIVENSDKNMRTSRFSSFNYCQATDLSSPKYHIVKSWKSSSFNLKATKPDSFLIAVKQSFNQCNDKPCDTEHCWLCSF